LIRREPLQKVGFQSRLIQPHRAARVVCAGVGRPASSELHPRSQLAKRRLADRYVTC